MTAQEIRKPVLLGNFRHRGPRKKEKSRRLKRPGMSAAHLDLIRKLPCCVTGRVPAGEAHHLKGTGERGVGMRSTDKWAVPLAHDPHMELEAVGSRNEVAWFKARGLEDPHALALDLWNSTGDLARMTKIVVAHRAASKRAR